MTAGALTQLVTSNGPQDLYLSMNPEMTYFKTVYKRHTNFAMESIPIEFTNNPGFGKMSRIKINRYGDMINKLCICIRINSMNKEYYEAINNAAGIDHQPNDTCNCPDCIEEAFKDRVEYGWVNALGHAIIESVHVEIGGARIDKQYGEWLEIWSELTLPPGKRAAYYELINKVDPKTWTPSTFISNAELYIPLQFWFCKDYGLALPLIALQYHDVEIVFNFRKFEECWVKIQPDAPDPIEPDFRASLLVNYIFVDLDERRSLISKSHIYLIEQLQICDNNELSGKHNNIYFYFNNPVKELLWTFQRTDVDKTKDWFNYGPFLDRTNCTIRDMFDTARIQINGIDRQRDLTSKYYRIGSKLYTHTVIPDNYIYSYPFCLYPEKIEPSGTMNFSYINDSRLIIHSTKRMQVPYKLKIYGINYNFLLITSGMGSTLFQ